MEKSKSTILKSLLVFGLINFGGLAIGGLFTGTGVSSAWYESLNKAPWTPLGWVFGAAWTLIMLCFSVYMAYLFRIEGRKVIPLYALAVFLNVAWNPVFFYQQWPILGLMVIVSLTLVVGVFLFQYAKQLGGLTVLIIPYLLWLCIASSLNAYILIYN